MRDMWKRIKEWISIPEDEEVLIPVKEKLPSKIKMRRRINTLESENEALKNTIKDELYKEFIQKLGEPEEIKRLREENKRLRLKIKDYKEEILNGNSNKK